MSIKKFVLSIVGIAIALALPAQSVYNISCSTYDAPNNLPYKVLLDKYCPNLQMWNNYKENFPCYVSAIKVHGHYSLPNEVEKYCYKDDDYFKEIASYKKENIESHNPFIVTLYRSIKGNVHQISIPTVYWNIAHKKSERFRDFIIKDFKLNRLIAIGVTDYGEMFFFIKNNEKSMTCYYYDSLDAFIYSNYGKIKSHDDVVHDLIVAHKNGTPPSEDNEAIDEDTIDYIKAWLANIPILDASPYLLNEGKDVLDYIKSQLKGRKIYSIDLPFTFIDDRPRSVL